jgi:hypothetical protein
MGLILGAVALPAEALFAAPPDTGRTFLPQARLQLLSAIADTLVPATDTPGAVQAGILPVLDGMLAHWASPGTRQEIEDALTAVDARAAAGGGEAFAALPPDRRTELLRTHDADAADDPGYRKLKELILSLYYSSEIGLTDELRYEPVPGEWQPSIKITPETRPYASFGPF